MNPNDSVAPRAAPAKLARVAGLRPLGWAHRHEEGQTPSTVCRGARARPLSCGNLHWSTATRSFNQARGSRDGIDRKNGWRIFVDWARRRPKSTFAFGLWKRPWRRDPNGHGLPSVTRRAPLRATDLARGTDPYAPFWRKWTGRGCVLGGQAGVRFDRPNCSGHRGRQVADSSQRAAYLVDKLLAEGAPPRQGVPRWAVTPLDDFGLRRGALFAWTGDLAARLSIGGKRPASNGCVAPGFGRETLKRGSRAPRLPSLCPTRRYTIYRMRVPGAGQSVRPPPPPPRPDGRLHSRPAPKPRILRHHPRGHASDLTLLQWIFPLQKLRFNRIGQRAGRKKHML